MTKTPLGEYPYYLSLADIRLAQQLSVVTVHNWSDAHDFRHAVERTMREKAARAALEQKGLRLSPDDFTCTWSDMPSQALYRLDIRWDPKPEPVLLVGGPGHGKLTTLTLHPFDPAAEFDIAAPVPDFVSMLRPDNGSEPCREIRIRTVTYKLSGFSSASVTPEGGRYMFSVAKVVG